MKTKTLRYAGHEATFTARDFNQMMADEAVKYALDAGLFYAPRPMTLIECGRQLSAPAERQSMVRLLRGANAAGKSKWDKRERKWLAEHPLKQEAKTVKTTKSQDLIAKAKELRAVVTARIKLEKREAELKALFLSKMGSEELLKAGELLIVISERTRTDLDRAALVERFGEKVVARFLKESTYHTVEVKTA